MPYKNIVFAKLEKRLLNDHRWFTMSEKAQLIYIKLILIAQDTYNEIPKNVETLHLLCRNKRRHNIASSIEEIKKNFPKFKESEKFYYFEDFHEKTNYIRECPSNAPVVPKEGIEKKRKDIEKEKEEDKEIHSLWIRTFGRTPKIPEIDETQLLIDRFGYEKVYQIYKQASLEGFKNLGTLIKALDENGNIKQKEQYGSNKKRGADGEFLRKLVEDHATKQSGN